MTHIFYAEVIEESADKGPYKQVRVQADNHEFRATVLESGGFHQSPLTGSEVLVALPDGDMGRATVIGGQPPKDRVDGQKPGMVTLKNHKRGQTVEMDDGGNINITISGTKTVDASKVVFNADVEINGEMTFNGNITQSGDFDQSGVHVDDNGPHTAVGG